MDDFVKDILSNWGILTAVEDSFTRNEINEDTFNKLSDDDIKELIPVIRVRKQFIENYAHYVTILKATGNSFIELESNNTVEDTSTFSSARSTPSSSKSTEEIVEKVDDESDEIHQVITVYPQHATLGLPYILSSHKNSVRRLLDSCDEGLMIKKSYTSDKLFKRSNLCNVIIRNEIKGNLDKRISSIRFQELAQEINEVFLHERPETYYVAYVNNSGGKPKSARGKLWSTYCYIRKNLRKLGLITKTEKHDSSQSATEDGDHSDEIVDDAIQWLKHNSTPFPQVQLYWKTTRNRRTSIYKGGSIEAYIKAFPILSEPLLGYQLLQIDFEELYPDKTEKLINKWPHLHGFILRLALKGDQFLINFLKKRPDNVADDVFALLVLPLLFKSLNIKSKSPGQHWKPSKVETQNAVLLNVASLEELETFLKLREQKYIKLKVTPQPIPVIVGPLDNIEQCCVCLNSVRYVVSTPLKAVDLCFKIFHSLNAEYPKEAEWVWTFIQYYIYEIVTLHDQKYVSVTSLISDIEILASDDPQ